MFKLKKFSRFEFYLLINQFFTKENCFKKNPIKYKFIFVQIRKKI